MLQSSFGIFSVPSFRYEFDSARAGHGIIIMPFSLFFSNFMDHNRQSACKSVNLYLNDSVDIQDSIIMSNIMRKCIIDRPSDQRLHLNDDVNSVFCFGLFCLSFRCWYFSICFLKLFVWFFFVWSRASDDFITLASILSPRSKQYRRWSLSLRLLLLFLLFSYQNDAKTKKIVLHSYKSSLAFIWIPHKKLPFIRM